MKNLLLVLAVGVSVYLAGCSAKQHDPQPVTPPSGPVSDSIRVVITASKVGTSAPGLFILSPRSPYMLSSRNQLLIYDWVNNATNKRYTRTLSKTALNTAFNCRTLYFSLQYLSVLSPSFNAPTGTDKVELQVTIDNNNPFTVRLDQAAYQTTTNRRGDNILVETSINF